MTKRTTCLVVGAFLLTSCGQPATTPQAGDLRERCATDAHNYYERGSGSPIPNYVSGYTNHYSEKLGRCFLLYTASHSWMDKNTNTQVSNDDKILVDVFENREIGSLNQQSDETRPRVCQIKGLVCNSAAQWDTLAKRYMED